MDVVCSLTTATATAMDCTTLKQYTDAEIRTIYYCKSYLNVQIISYLCTADGVFVLPSIVKGERSIRQCTSKLEEIRQDRPGGRKWTIWRQFLKTICKNETATTRNRTTSRKGGRLTNEIGQRMRLRVPRGNWIISANESERLWPFYYSHNTDTLYRSYREEWHRNGEFYYDCHNITDNDTYDYTTTWNVKLLPEDASPTDVMNGYRRRVENINTSPNVEYRTGK
jgi:hypothetical protein